MYKGGDSMKALKDLKQGDYFTRKKIDYPSENQVFIRGEYDRASKKYICIRFSDVNSWIFLKGNTTVFDSDDFIF